MSSYGLLDDDGFARTDGGMPVREECPGECCDGGGVPCFYRFDGCPVTGECAVSAPPVYIPCDAVCGDGSPAADRVITIDSTDYAGWCWRRVDDCRYTEGPDIPPGWCELPQDAVVVEEGIGCVADCDDGACSRRGTYLIPDLCEGACGPEDRNVLVCPTENADLSRCQFVHASLGNGYCGCVVVGPHSREFEGDPTGYTIVTNDGGWAYALDPQAACCECCANPECQGGDLCEYRRIAPPANSKWAPWCFDKYYPDGVACCCGKTWTVTAVATSTYHYVNQQIDRPHYRAELRFAGWSMATTAHDAGGSAECVSVHASVNEYERVSDDDGVSFSRNDVWTADTCGGVAWFGFGNDGCLVRGGEMFLLQWQIAYPENAPAGVWDQAAQMLNSYYTASGFGTGGPGKCSGSADVLDCPSGLSCEGSYAVSGACHIGRVTATLSQSSESGGYTFDEEWSMRGVLYRVITSQQEDCGGGCGGRRPRDIDEGGNVGVGVGGNVGGVGGVGTTSGGGMLGAGDIL